MTDLGDFIFKMVNDMNRIRAMELGLPASHPKPAKKVPEDPTSHLCDCCGDQKPVVFTDDEGFCQDCADYRDAKEEL